MATYRAGSLADIAQMFEKLADDAARSADRATTKKMRDLNNRESSTWSRAANVLRETTLEPTNA